MPQIFVDPQNISGNKFTVKGPEAHHLTRVLRCQPRDSIRIFDGTGRQYQGVLTRINSQDSTVEGQITEVLSAVRPHHYLRLFQGLPKGQKFDYVIEKAVELGVDEIIPFVSQKSIIKIEPEQAIEKQNRWTRLVKSAAKQCNRTTLPAVSAPSELMELGSQINKGFSLLFTESSKSQPLRDVLKNQVERSLPESARINIIIGPESGLNDKESSWLVGLGARLVSLGSLTLRTETAGLVAASIINYEFQRI